jgi:hypothetical protein
VKGRNKRAAGPGDAARGTCASAWRPGVADACQAYDVPLASVLVPPPALRTVKAIEIRQAIMREADAGAEIRNRIAATHIPRPSNRFIGEELGQGIHDHLLVPQHGPQHLFMFFRHR